jgi:hypothetical protein
MGSLLQQYSRADFMVARHATSHCLTEELRDRLAPVCLQSLAPIIGARRSHRLG